MPLGQFDYEAIEIAIRATGQQGVADLQQQVARLDAEIKNYQALLAAGLVLNKEQLDDLAKLSAAYAQTTLQVAAAERVLQGLPAALTNAKNGFANAGQAAVQLAYVIDDLQYGFSAIVNNLPILIQTLGGGPGLAGVLGVLGVAANQLIKNWDQLEGLFGLGVPRPILDGTAELKSKLDEATKITKDLGSQTNLSLEELRHYKEATQQVKDFNAELERRKDLEAILSAKSKAQREAGSAFKEALAETGGGVALDALDTAVGQGADAKGMVFNEFKGKNTSSRELAEDLIREAGGGDRRARGQVLDLLGKAYKPQKGDFASNIRATMPETIAAEKAANEDAEDDAKDALDRKRDAAQIRQRLAQRAAQEARDKERAANQDEDTKARDLAKMNRDADTLRAKAKADEDRMAREAPGIAKHSREAGYAQDFQAQTGANDQQAMEAGRRVNALTSKGMAPNQAMETVFNQMLRTIVEQQAALEQASGFFGQYSQQFQQIQMRARAVRGNLGRLQQRAPSIGITF